MNSQDLVQVKRALESLRQVGNNIENNSCDTISKSEILSLVKAEFYVLDEIARVLEKV